MFLTYISYFAFALLSPIRITPEDQYFVGYCALLLGLVLEAIILATVGITPGKALLNIKLVDHYGNRLSLPESLRRCWDILFRGYGLGIPLVATFTQIWQKNKLRRDGKTSWDERYDLKVIHGPIGGLRIAGFAIAFLVLYLFITITGMVATKQITEKPNTAAGKGKPGVQLDFENPYAKYSDEELKAIAEDK